MTEMVIIEGAIPRGWEEVPLKDGDRRLWFTLVGALITKSRIERDGGRAIVVQQAGHFEVHRLRKRKCE